MKQFVCITAAASLLLAGCSKKEEAVEAEAAPTGDAPAAAPKQANTQLKATLDTVQTDIEKAQYEEAVQKLLAARATMQTEADRKAYEDRMFEANQALLERAKTDPKAQESYQALGRIITGR
jgi:PBP1b-binding outer membrane lipoprotein LpoB